MHKNKNSFTLIELLVVVAIIAVLVAMLLPALNQARNMARQQVCGSRLRQQGMAFDYYHNDNNDSFPGFYNQQMTDSFVWWIAIAQYLAGNTNYSDYQNFNPETTTYGMFQCPCDTNNKKSGWVIFDGPSYGMNRYLAYHKLSEIEQASSVILGGDSSHKADDMALGFPPVSAIQLRGVAPDGTQMLGENIYFRHGEVGNVLWVDGHISSEQPMPLLDRPALWANQLKVLNPDFRTP